MWQDPPPPTPPWDLNFPPSWLRPAGCQRLLLSLSAVWSHNEGWKVIFHVLPRWKYAAALIKVDVDLQNDIIYIMGHIFRTSKVLLFFLELCIDQVSKRTWLKPCYNLYCHIPHYDSNGKPGGMQGMSGRIGVTEYNKGKQPSERITRRKYWVCDDNCLLLMTDRRIKNL